MFGVLLLGLVVLHWRKKIMYKPIHYDDDDTNREDDVDVEITV